MAISPLATIRLTEDQKRIQARIASRALIREREDRIAGFVAGFKSGCTMTREDEKELRSARAQLGHLRRSYKRL